jgi:hypothetical protein
MAYEIEDVAVEVSGRGQRSRYPLEQLGVGQSFLVPAKELVPAEGEDPGKPLARLRSLVASFQAKYRVKEIDGAVAFTRRYVVGKPDKKGVRVGRTE